ncbi:hypothetical protein SynMVIR181_01142 [Synechococcus sp. MVIR-18-1]|nr:hypothetical protein SynMVIR181_01142 [Synechococcus sp. MVIR-18-1]
MPLILAICWIVLEEKQVKFISVSVHMFCFIAFDERYLLVVGWR